MPLLVNKWYPFAKIVEARITTPEGKTRKKKKHTADWGCNGIIVYTFVSS